MFGPIFGRAFHCSEINGSVRARPVESGPKKTESSQGLFTESTEKSLAFLFLTLWSSVPSVVEVSITESGAPNFGCGDLAIDLQGAAGRGFPRKEGGAVQSQG